MYRTTALCSIWTLDVQMYAENFDMAVKWWQDDPSQISPIANSEVSMWQSLNDRFCAGGKEQWNQDCAGNLVNLMLKLVERVIQVGNDRFPFAPLSTTVQSSYGICLQNGEGVSKNFREHYFVTNVLLIKEIVRVKTIINVVWKMVRIRWRTSCSLSHPFSEFEMSIFLFGWGNLFQMFIALNVLPGNWWSSHISSFRCFDRFPSTSWRRFERMAFLRA
jgi:hypothetical protein